MNDTTQTNNDEKLDRFAAKTPFEESRGIVDGTDNVLPKENGTMERFVVKFDPDHRNFTLPPATEYNSETGEMLMPPGVSVMNASLCLRVEKSSYNPIVASLGICQGERVVASQLAYLVSDQDGWGRINITAAENSDGQIPFKVVLEIAARRDVRTVFIVSAGFFAYQSAERSKDGLLIPKLQNGGMSKKLANLNRRLQVISEPQ